MTLRRSIQYFDISSFDKSEFTQTLAECSGNSALWFAAEIANHGYRALLRPRCKLPRRHRTAKRGNEFSPPDIDCHVTFPRGSCPCNDRGRYHTFVRPCTAMTAPGHERKVST